MNLPLALSAAFLLAGSQAEIAMRELADPYGGIPRLQTYFKTTPVTEIKVSPKKFPPDDQPYLFEWLVGGMCRLETEPDRYTLRFRVYSQERTRENDLAERVTRSLLRLWDYTYRRLRIDHNSQINIGLVDVYLCREGKPGGEQLFDKDPQIPPSRDNKVNTIYIYDLGTFTDPTEQIREIAHEYGHAVLPAVGGFEEPEDWGNGYLGERLYLRWILRDLEASRIDAADFMGVTVQGLRDYNRTKVDALANQIFASGPGVDKLKATGQAAMNQYLGLCLAMESTLPAPVFARTLKLSGSTRAIDLIKAMPLAMSEVDQITMNFPKSFVGKNIWLPLGGGKIMGSPILKKENGWAMIKGPASAQVGWQDLSKTDLR